MPNLIKDADFEGMEQLSGNDIVDNTAELVGGDSKHVHLISNVDSAQVGYMQTIAASYGQTYKFQVWAKKISGEPRIWAELHDSAQTRIRSIPGAANFQYKEIDTVGDWSVYNFIMTCNAQDTDFIEFKVGFWKDSDGTANLGGEVYFKNPHLELIEDDYNEIYQDRVLAKGFLGWDGGTNDWLVYPNAFNHNVGSVVWDDTVSELTINYKHPVSSNVIYPLVEITPYSKGQDTLSHFAIPVVLSSTASSCKIIFLDETNSKVDPHDFAGNYYVSFRATL